MSLHGHTLVMGAADVGGASVCLLDEDVDGAMPLTPPSIVTDAPAPHAHLQPPHAGLSGLHSTAMSGDRTHRHRGAPPMHMPAQVLSAACSTSGNVVVLGCDDAQVVVYASVTGALRRANHRVLRAPAAAFIGASPITAVATQHLVQPAASVPPAAVAPHHGRVRGATGVGSDVAVVVAGDQDGQVYFLRLARMSAPSPNTGNSRSTSTTTTPTAAGQGARSVFGAVAGALHPLPGTWCVLLCVFL